MIEELKLSDEQEHAALWQEIEAAVQEYLSVVAEGDEWETTLGWYALAEKIGRILERDVVLPKGEGFERYQRWHGLAPFRCGACGSAVAGAGYGPPGSGAPYVTVVTHVCPTCLVRALSGEVMDEEDEED